MDDANRKCARKFVPIGSKHGCARHVRVKTFVSLLIAHQREHTERDEEEAVKSGSKSPVHLNYFGLALHLPRFSYDFQIHHCTVFCF